MLDIFKKYMGSEENVGLLNNAATKGYLRQFFTGKDDVINKGFLHPSELNALRQVAQNALATGSNNISYKHYNPEAGKGISYSKQLESSDVLDPFNSLKHFIGKGRLTRDAQGQLFVEDNYDFDSPEGTPDMSHLDKIKDIYNTGMNQGIYGAAHKLAEYYGDNTGEGSPIRINLGNAADMGVTEQMLSRLPSASVQPVNNIPPTLNPEGALAKFFGLSSSVKPQPVVQEVPVPKEKPQPKKDEMYRVNAKGKSLANVSAKQLKSSGLSLNQYMNQWKKTGSRPQ